MKVIVTGGLGFIGSQIVEKFAASDMIDQILIIDNQSSGSIKNISGIKNAEKFIIYHADIRDKETLVKITKGFDVMIHQAAMVSVPQSIEEPSLCMDINVNGFVSILEACRINNIKKVIYASSAAVYGDSQNLPIFETEPLNPKSPYATSKVINEQIADCYALNYDMQLFGLRYFNVFGPKQSLNSSYASVIPIFCDNITNDKKAIIFGDGEQTRDFVYVKDIAIIITKIITDKLYTNIDKHIILNIGTGESITVNEVWEKISKIANKKTKFSFKPERKGEIKHSLANTKLMESIFQYKPIKNTAFLEETYNYYKTI